MSHITFKAEFSPELVDQSNDALGMTYNTQGPGHSKSNLPPLMRLVSTQVTIVQPLYLHIAEVEL